MAKGTWKIGALAASAAGFMWAGAASAETLKYAFGYPAASTVGIAAEDYAAAIKERSGGSLTVRNFPMSLLSLVETGPGLRDGMADIGYVVAAFTPKDFPRYMLMQDMQLMVNLQKPRGKESVAYAGAVIEYTLTKCPKCLSEFQGQNQVYMGGATSSLNMALCTKPVRTMEELKGMKIRVSHAVVSRLFTELGATPVSFPANESYEALSQGVADCTQLSMPELTNMSLADVVKSVTVDLPGGLSSNVAVNNMNLESWRKLNDEQRGAMLWGASQISADITWGYYADAITNEKLAKDRNIQLVHGDEAVMEKMRDFARKDLPSTLASYKTTYGVEDSETIATEFQAMYAKWLDLVDPVETRDQLRELFWNQMFKNVDPKTYGM
ncbi:C4-dicarboxylate TRAP transporter substrate-binding protein [Gemmobacter nectariphilus]|uniref:C4-dicarboxylate TRAP transporter substrate-binding protein n=1 Tax=Gemmobacter nectariphilus TaxID=220343 RepID=UPI0004833593|nr:C4-dicarboxylate TRAP transporter substrate-binding protein [Gemmobacter nectariphilus]